LHGSRNGKILLDNNTAVPMGAVTMTTSCLVGVPGAGLTTVVIPQDLECSILLSRGTGNTPYSSFHSIATAMMDYINVRPKADEKPA